MRQLRISAQVIDEEDIKEASAALRGDLITRGPYVEKFEEAFADYVGAKGAVAFNSGTSALSAAYEAVETTPYDQVITTPNTFVGTVTGAYLKGAMVSYADIDACTGNVDIEKMAELMNKPRSRGKEILVPVHFAGQSIDMALLEAQIKSPNTVIIEDACHAIGSLDPQGNKVGACTYSAMTVFSLHPQKNITTMEGGIVTSNDSELLNKLRLFRNNGMIKLSTCEQPWFYEVMAFTGNYNFTEVQGALGLSQLKKMEGWVSQREALRVHYLKELGQIPGIRALSSASSTRSAWHLFVVLIDFEERGLCRAQVMQKLASCGIQTQVHYIPLYMHPAVKKKGKIEDESFEQMQNYYSCSLSLPFHCAMTKEDASYVIAQLKKAMI